MDLLSMKCAPLPPSTRPLTRKEIRALLPQVPDWSLDEGHLVTRFECRDFAECTRIFSEVIAIAMEEGHFPDICISRSRYVDILLYTYAIGGLSLNDFILAARISGRTRRDLRASAL